MVNQGHDGAKKTVVTLCGERGVTTGMKTNMVNKTILEKNKTGSRIRPVKGGMQNTLRSWGFKTGMGDTTVRQRHDGTERVIRKVNKKVARFHPGGYPTSQPHGRPVGRDTAETSVVGRFNSRARREPCGTRKHAGHYKHKPGETEPKPEGTAGKTTAMAT